jgi:hypothetical protein
MGFILKGEPSGESVQKALPKAGARPARLVKVIDLGIHKREFKGEPKQPCQQIVLEFDLVSDLHTFNEELGPQPIRVNTGYFFPLNVVFGPDGVPHEKSKLREYIRALDPTNECDYDLSKMLLRPCILNIELNAKEGKTYANIESAGPIPEIDGFTVADTNSVPYIFDLDNFTDEEWEELPDFIKEIVRDAENSPFKSE